MLLRQPRLVLLDASSHSTDIQSLGPSLSFSPLIMIPALARFSPRTMPKPSILLVGLPVPPGVELPPVKVAWSDKPIDVTQEIKDVVPLMRERGYEDYEYMG